MKITLAQITSDPGEIAKNTEKIIACIDKFRDKVDLIVFPELAIPGYAVMDLVYDKDFIDANLAALEKIKNHAKNIAVVVGFIDRDQSILRAGNRPTLYNCAAFIYNSKIISKHDKTHLPDYDIFFEKRYFVQARKRELVNFQNTKIGIQICEDLWDKDYALKVTRDLALQGAELIINISASPFHVNKLEERLNLLKETSQSNQVSLAYVNLIGSFDGLDGEIVFDGRSMFVDKNANILYLASGFKEDCLIVDTQSKTSIPVPISSDEQEILNALTLGIQEYFRRLKFKRAYIGISGGIDSALVATIACLALGKENVTGVTMPSHITSNETRNDAYKLCQNLGMQLIERPITPEFKAWEEEFKRCNNKEPLSLTKQNKQARIRGAILMEYTNEDRASIVLSTGNKTELALGYCTLYGDMCGGLAVISDLSKERVYALARYINQISSKELIPQSIIERVPTAELETGQTDRANLPADYPILSPLVDTLIEDNFSNKEIEKLYQEEVILKTQRLIANNEFKRRQAAPGIRVTKKAFGIGRRVPMRSIN
jgi:NAD+ synthase (glutamine-hydrolysing)